MTKRWLLPLSLVLSFGCTPAADDNNTGNGGSTARGGSGGGSSARGGSGGGSSSTTGGSSGSTTGGSSGSTTGGSSGSTNGGAGGGSGPVGGSGGSGRGGAGGAGGSAGGTGGSRDGGATPTEGGMSSGGPAAVLDNYVITVPCPAGAMGGSCNVGTDVRAFDKALKFGGDPAKTYKVTLKICALYETRPYTGCSAMPNPRHCVNGTPGTGGFAATYPTLGLKVAEPMATHYLNGMYQADTIVRIDYMTTIDIKGGSALNFISDGGSNGGIYTQRMKPAFMPCPDVPGVMQPYSGQFAHFKVVSVDPPM